jgi:hypothetical protein
VDSLRHTCRYWVSPAAVATGAAGRDPASRPLRNRSPPNRARNPLGRFVLCRPLSDSCRVWLKVCQLARIRNNATHSPHVGARPLVRTATSAVGGPLQLVDLLAGLVPDRRSHLPGLLCGSPASPDGSTWITVTLVGFWWAFQHSVFPFVLDWRLILFRFLQFLPLVVIFQLIYLRTRRLPRMIVMHWPMDLFAALLTLKL